MFKQGVNDHLSTHLGPYVREYKTKVYIGLQKYNLPSNKP